RAEGAVGSAASARPVRASPLRARGRRSLAPRRRRVAGRPAEPARRARNRAGGGDVRGPGHRGGHGLAGRADRCAVTRLVAPDRAGRRARAGGPPPPAGRGHHPPLRVEPPTRFARIDSDSELPAAVAVRERRTVRSATRTDTIERYPEVGDADRTSEGFLATPLQVGAESFGVLVFGFDGGIEALDQTFLEIVAGQLAQAVMRIRLATAVQERADFASEVVGRERHRRAQLEFLAELTQTAIRATDHRQLMRTVTAAA